MAAATQGIYTRLTLKRRGVAVVATQRPTTSCADITANGTRSQRPHDEERATQQSEQETQGGVRDVVEEKLPQKDNTHTTEITSEQNEGPEWGEVNGQDIRSDATARYIAEIRDVQDSMECGEEMTEDTYTTMECQPLCKQLSGDRGATAWDEQNKGERQDKGSEGGERVRMQPDKGQNSTTLSSPRKTKTEINEERTHVRKRRTRNSSSKTHNHNVAASTG